MGNCSIFRLFTEYKYPDEIIKLLNAKYKVIRMHERKIKNIRKNSKVFTIFGHTFGYFLPEELRRIKHHKYIINKVRKDIKGIKENYKKIVCKTL